MSYWSIHRLIYYTFSNKWFFLCLLLSNLIHVDKYNFVMAFLSRQFQLFAYWDFTKKTAETVIILGLCWIISIQSPGHLVWVYNQHMEQRRNWFDCPWEMDLAWMASWEEYLFKVQSGDWLWWIRLSLKLISPQPSSTPLPAHTSSNPHWRHPHK